MSSRTSAPRSVRYGPRVVVKFRDHIELPYTDKVAEYVDKLEIGPWRQLVEQFPGITIRRMFTAASVERIREIIDSAIDRNRLHERLNLLTYFIVDCPSGVDPDELTKALRTWRSVQVAYFDPPVDDPVVNAADDPRSPNQGYLDAAPDGIDAESAWRFTGGDEKLLSCPLTTAGVGRPVRYYFPRDFGESSAP